MKELLDVLKGVDGLSTPTLFLFGLIVLGYLGFLWWKNFRSETALLDRKKRRLELVKLAMEIENLRKQVPVSETEMPGGYSLRSVLDVLPESKADRIKPTLENLFRHPLKFSRGILLRRPKWLRYAFVGSLAASAYPIFIISYTLLHLPPNSSAQLVYGVFWIQLSIMALTVIAAGILSAVYNMDDMVLTLIMSCGVGFGVYTLVASSLPLILKLVTVFLNAH